ncbi:hypothetical protein BH09PSE1_BH09PSE1_04840 [soil metagenome]
MEQLAHGLGRARLGLWGRIALCLVLERCQEDREMMSGVVSFHRPEVAPAPRRYDVIARAGGWSIALNDACTRPFRSRRAAERIARALQKQADALNGLTPPRRAH